MNKNIIIGIAGGSGSGKTTFVNKIKNKIQNVSVLSMDSYYKRSYEKDYNKRANINYDSPLAFDLKLFERDLEKLKYNEEVYSPVYDFSIHNRTNTVKKIEPNKIILVEGILIYHTEKLKDLIDIKIFIDLDSDLRFIRRLERDIRYRKRTLESVAKSYIKNVKPSYEKYIKGYKAFANIIIPNRYKNDLGFDILIDYLKNLENN